jgi:bifunctional DNase/RNase
MTGGLSRRFTPDGPPARPRGAHRQGSEHPPTRTYNGRKVRPGREIAVQQMQIYGVSFDMVGKQPIVLLKTVDGNRFLPIWIGHPEAAAILMKLQGASTPRPMTHDLLSDLLEQLDAKCERVAVTELRDNTFYASITISVNGSELEIDSRPSDAIALAVRTQAPIFAADDVIDESSIEFEHEVEDTEEVVEKFKDFLDQVTPEDFAKGEE